MSSVPRIVERYPNFVDLAFHNKAGVQAYRVGTANTLDTAYAGVTALFDVTQDAAFRSPALRRRRLGFLHESTRGLTRALFDPEEYFTVGGIVPHDNQLSFMRIQEQNLASVWRPAGPIMLLPPPNFYGIPNPGIPLAGTAPNVAATVTGIPATTCMHIVFPKACHIVTVRNLDAANALFFCNDPGVPMMELPSDTESMYIEGGVDTQLFIRGDGAPVSFVVYIALNTGHY